MTKTISEYLAGCPPLLRASDLVAMGIFDSVGAAASARNRQIGPRALKLSKGKYRYAIEDVIKYFVEAGMDIK